MSANPYSEALRIIGCDLEFRGIKTFSLCCDTDPFVLEGGYQSPPAVTPVTLQYGSDEFVQLERKFKERNPEPAAVVDLLSLPQILCAIGTYVTAKDARLVTVSNIFSTAATPVIRIEYKDIERGRFVEDLMGSSIYELCLSAYKAGETSNSTKKNIRYTRFSHLQEN